MTTTRSTRRPPAQRFVPLGYLAAALVLAVALLPTALRPPVDQQSASAAFSPDAPPDDTPPEALLASIRQASSSTAGAGADDTATEEIPPEEIVVQAPPPPPPPRKASRGRCFGDDPPRQTESLYSALCVPAWTGTDNGGETYRGIYANEIRVAVAVAVNSTANEGPVESEFHPEDTETVRRLKVWQSYVNDRFELYGRYLRFYVVKMSDQEEDQARAAVRKAVDEYKAFALIGSTLIYPTAAAANEAIRQKMVVFIPGNNPVDFYKESHPFAYSFHMDSWQTRYLGTELACKQFAGKPPGSLNNKADPLFDYTKPRVWGLITYQDEVRGGATQMYMDRMRKCGIEFKATHEYNLTDNQQAIAGSMVRMRNAGVTTIILGIDPITPAVLTNEAQRIGYQPEYIGATGLDSNTAGRLMQDDQSTHAVAISSAEIPRKDEDKDWYRAYKEVDPEGEAETTSNSAMGAWFFRSLQQLAGGLQMAGTRVTPETFWEGLTKQPYRKPEPVWSMGGGYRKPDPASELHFLGDYTYTDYVDLLWFDLQGDDPDSELTGAWCHVWGGKRFRYGELPGEEQPVPWFDRSQCIFTPPEGSHG